MTTTELNIEGGPKPHVVRSLRELSAYRHTIQAFAERDVRVKYKQAALGVAWAVIQPLTFMLIFAFAFGGLADVGGGGAPYPAFVLSALVPWTFLQTAVTFGAGSLLADAPLVRKVYFPREVPVLGSVLSSCVDFGIGLGLFFILGPFLGAKVSATWLLAPILGLVLVLLGAGVSCALAALNVYYRDFRYAVPFMLQIWLFASPVAYPLTAVPERWRDLYVVLNPAAGALDGFRNVLALGRMPELDLLLISFLGSLVVASTGYRIFKGLEPQISDVI